MNRIFLIAGFAAGILLIACKKESVSDSMQGSWIESTQRKDTIEFVSFADTKDKWLNLKCTKGANGLPQYANGYYTMTISQDSVILRWSLSSSISNKNYYFKFNSNKNSFVIDNFYKHDIANGQLRFEKLK